MDKPLWALSNQELRDALVHVFAEEQRWVAQRLELIREIDARNIPRGDGATSMTVWLNGVLRITPNHARRMQATAIALESVCGSTATAMAAGMVHEAQAEVIGRCVTGLAEYGATVQCKAEQIPLENARKLDPHGLDVLARGILCHIDPEAADEHLRKQLEAEEKKAARDRFVNLIPDGSGRTRLYGLLGPEAAAMLAAAMEPLCRPADPDDTRTAGQRRADALRDICAFALATDKLPENRGEKSTMTVTFSYDQLLRQVSEGLLDTGALISAEAVRRLACAAGIIPAVLNSAGVPLDVGRQRRLFHGAIRKALELRDGGCCFPGCDRPPKWCDAHHCDHWLAGGKTSLDNGCLLCGHHHRLIHNSDWVVYIAADGMPEFIPPAHVDPTRTPRRNTFHRRT